MRRRTPRYLCMSLILPEILLPRLMATPLAAAEGWRENQEKQFAAGLVMVPPQTSKFVMGAEMDLEHMQPIWETMLLDVKYEPSIPKIAARLGGINSGMVQAFVRRDECLGGAARLDVPAGLFADLRPLVSRRCSSSAPCPDKVSF